MEQYKQLNKELVEQIQKLKLENAAYCREMNYLRDQYYDEHRKNIEAKESAIKLFTMGLHVLAPDLGLSKLISESMLKETLTNGYRKSNGGARHSSGEILKELRRSSSIHQQRNIVAVSPVRRRSSQQKLNKSSPSLNESTEEENENTTCQTINGSSTLDEADASVEEDRESLIKAKAKEIYEKHIENDVESILAKDLDIIEEQADELSNRVKNSSCSPVVCRKSIDYKCSQSIPAVRFSLGNGTGKCTKSVLNGVDMDATRISVDCISPSTSTIIDFTMQNFENATCSTPRNACEDMLDLKDCLKRRSLRLQMPPTESLGATCDGTRGTMSSTTTAAAATTTASTFNNTSSQTRLRRTASASVSYKEVNINSKQRNENAPLRGKKNKNKKK